MSKSLRRGSALVAAACMISPLGFAAPAVAAEGDTVTLFGINDFHGRISSSGADLACTLETERAEIGDTGTSFFLSAGDNIGASEFASYLSDDNPTIDYLNALELDSSSVGNHEFDKGYDDLSGRVTDRSNYEQLGANVYKADGTRALKPYSIEERDGVRVAVIGVVTESTKTLVSPSGIEGLEFRDQVSEVNKAMDELEASGEQVDLVVAEYHDGSDAGADPGSAPSGDFAARIAAETDPRVDAIFNGHTHRSYNYVAPDSEGQDRPIIQTGSYGENLAQVTFVEGADGSYSVDPASIELTPTGGASEGANCASFPRYVEATGIVDQANAVAEQKGSEVVGEQTGDITTAWNSDKAEYLDGVWTAKPESAGESKGDDRAASSALSNVAAQSQVWALNRESYFGKKADIGVMLPGSMRADLFYKGDNPDGVISMKEANDPMPFANTVNTVDLTGAQLIQMLEQQWQPEGEKRSYLQLGLSENVKYTFDATAPKGEHITGLWIDGKPVDPNETYTVAGQSFLIDGGDNFTVFTEGTNRVDTGLIDRDTWIDYIKENSPLSPDYSQRGVGVTDLAPEAKGTEEDPPRFRITNVHSTSLGAPQIKEVKITMGDQVFTAPYEYNEELGAWAADIDLTAECLEAGEYEATLTAVPDEGTEVTMPFEVTREGGLPDNCSPETPDPTDPTDPADPTDPTDPTDPAKPSDPADPTEPADPSEPAPSDEPAPTDDGSATVPVNGGDDSKPSAPAHTEAQGPTSHSSDSAPAASTNRHGYLPRTGAEIAPYAIGAAALVLLGGIAMLARRKFNK